MYLFVEFLGGTIRFEFLDKRDFWTTPAVERYQEQSVGQRRAIIAERYQLDVGLPLALLEGTLYMVLWGERKIAAVFTAWVRKREREKEEEAEGEGMAGG